MKQFLQKLFGKANYDRLERFKKQLLPTEYDKQQQQFIKEQIKFYSQLVKPNDLCFDIGGNIGLKTAVFLELKARVVTLEPQQDCVEILKTKYGKATILQKGAGAVNEIKEFYVSNNPALSSFTEGWIDEFKDSRFAGSSIKAVEKIEIVTLDSLIETYGKPAFIKIDVEGFELEVLKGLSKDFGSLSFEYAVPEKRSNVIEALQYLHRKYRNIVCNYVVCNDNSFALNEWLPAEEMLEYIQNDFFSSTFAGDIYVKTL